MPIYEYECVNCGTVFEVVTKVIREEDEYQPCSRRPNCQGKAERTIPRTAPPQFNGPGFHATDYKGIK